MLTRERRTITLGCRTPAGAILNLDPVHVEKALQQLLALGLLQAHADDAARATFFELTEHGITEGKRCFLEEFSPDLGIDSHLGCGDVGCACPVADWDGICHTVERH